MKTSQLEQFTRSSNRRFATLAFAASSLAVIACGGTTGSNPEPATTKASLVFKSPCAVSSCPAAPAGAESVYTCAAASGTCDWAAGSGVVGSRDPNGTVSYRECDESECAGSPLATDCPAGTHSLGLRCGSENEAACTSYAVCVPDESDAGATVTCGPEDCGPIPEIAELCADGTSAGLVCGAKGSKCVPVSGCPKN